MCGQMIMSQPRQETGCGGGVGEGDQVRVERQIFSLRHFKFEVPCWATRSGGFQWQLVRNQGEEFRAGDIIGEMISM